MAFEIKKVSFKLSDEQIQAAQAKKDRGEELTWRDKWLLGEDR